MKLLELNIREGQKAVLKTMSNYARMGIDVEVLETGEEALKVKIEQKRLINGYILNQKELVLRAKEVFKSTGLNIKVIPVVFGLDVSIITPEWIKAKMEEFGIKRNDIIKQLAIDKSSLSLYFSGKVKMNKLVKAAFYYYFLTYELNQDFRSIP